MIHKANLLIEDGRLGLVYMAMGVLKVVFVSVSSDTFNKNDAAPQEKK